MFRALATAGGPPAEVLIDSSAVKAHRCASGGKGGERSQAIGRSRGGRTTKIHALTDKHCRPIAFLLTGGQVADCVAAEALLDQMSAADLVHADKGYDTNAVRRKIEATGAAPNIPPKSNGSGRTASRHTSIETGMRSSECSVGLRISAGLRRATTGSPETSTPQSASLPSSATGYESQP